MKSLSRLPLVLILTLGSVLSGLAIAEEKQARPIVIRDYGNTRPSGIPDIVELRKLAYQMRVPVSELIQFSPYAFPIASEKFKLGNLPAVVKHERTSIIPFFIVGGDTHSMEWLIRNKRYLIDNKIVRGLITNVSDGKTFKRFSDAAAPLQLHPMNVDELADLFSVNVYPIVITPTEIAQ